jgi:hypothetical protein
MQRHLAAAGNPADANRVSAAPPLPPFLTADLPEGPGRPPRAVCRLGLATRGTTGSTS